MKIVIADTVNHKVRRLGSYHNDLGRDSSVVMSPDGDRLVGVLGSPGVIRVLDPRDGRTLATAGYKVRNLQVLAYVDAETILAQADESTPSTSRRALLVIHLHGNDPAQIDRIVAGDLYFSGWVR